MDWNLVPFFILFFALNAFFIISETAIASSHKKELEKLFPKTPAGINRLEQCLKLLDLPHEYMSAARLGNIICNILIGILAIGTIIPYMQVILNTTGPLDGIVSWMDINYIHLFYRDVAILISVILIILLTVTLTTIMPRKIIIQSSERWLIRIRKPFMFWYKCLQPFLYLCNRLANTILLILGFNLSPTTTITEATVKDLMEKGTETGIFEKEEQDLVDRIFHLGDETAYTLMTPRTQMQWLDLEDSLEDNLKIIRDSRHLVFLVGRENLDEFVGIIYVKDMLDTFFDKQDLDLEKLTRKPIFVPRSMESFRVLEKLRANDCHEAIVLDEYGGVVGFITLLDIINEILGDINGANISNNPQLIQRDNYSWYIDGLYEIDDFKEKFGIEKLPHEELGHFKTMGGFLTAYFGYIPRISERRTWKNYQFEVIAMDKARISRILLTIIPKKQA